MKYIGIITTSRADYSIYVPVLRALAKQKIRADLFVTGMHFQKRFGFTVRAIERDGFSIAARVPCAMKETPLGMAASMGTITTGMAKALERKRPELLLVLGDRYDMHAAALAGVALGIPLAHLHGGESTQGAMDELFRHSLTKLSHLHFVSTKAYAKRIIQMGEDPRSVIVSGAPGLDNALDVPLMSVKELSRMYKADLTPPYILVTFHPVTTELSSTGRYMDQMLKALVHYPDHQIIFTAPNADPTSDQVRRSIGAFTARHPHAVYIENFGTSGYINALRHAKAMVGNSSSGIIEAASFALPVVNIGTRQGGRLHTKNVIDTSYEASSIRIAINKALSPGFKISLKGLKNPYGNGHAARKIVSVLKKLKPEQIRPKVFHE